MASAGGCRRLLQPRPRNGRKSELPTVPSRKRPGLSGRRRDDETTPGPVAAPLRFRRRSVAVPLWDAWGNRYDAVMLMLLTLAAVADLPPYFVDVAASGGQVFLLDRANRSIIAVDSSGGQSALVLPVRSLRQPLAGMRAIVATDRELFIADPSSRDVFRMPLDGSAEPSALTGGRLGTPAGLATDGITLWVADQLRHEIVAVDLATATVQPVASVRGPRGLAWADGVLSIVTGDQKVQRIDLSDNKRTEVAIDGVTSAADVVTQGGRVYLSDPDAGLVRSVSLDAPTEQTTLTAPGIVRPVGLAIDGDRLLVADAKAGRLIEIALPPAN